MEPACDVCVKILKNKNDIPIQENSILTLDVSANIINPPIQKLTGSDKTANKSQRDEFIFKLKKYISALRNTHGGALLVHINNIEPTDRCLEHFHELIDVRLNCMIDDGSLFVETYNTDWMPDTSDGKCLGFVAIIVQPSVSVVTLNFHTKLPLDNSIEDPSTQNIVKILKKGLSIVEKEANIRGIDRLQENRHVQAKAFYANVKNDDLRADEEKLITYIWVDLRLGQYISAFSKVDGGGSYYLGIEEYKKEYSEYGYSSKELRLAGFPCSELLRSSIETKLKKKIETDTLLLVKEENCLKYCQPKNLIEVAFHPVPHDKDLFVLEVAVAAVEGLLFCDKTGPEAYVLDENGIIKRLDRTKWCERLMRLATCGGKSLCEK